MTAHLIFYNDQDCYEGQDKPFAIALSKEWADIIVKDIRARGQKIASQMLYPFEDGISDEEYSRREENNSKLLTDPWPHGWVANSSDFSNNYSSGDGEPITMIFDENTVCSRELPVLD